MWLSGSTCYAPRLISREREREIDIVSLYYDYEYELVCIVERGSWLFPLLLYTATKYTPNQDNRDLGCRIETQRAKHKQGVCPHGWRNTGHCTVMAHH